MVEGGGVGSTWEERRTASEGPLMSASVPLLLSGLKFIALSPVHLPHQYGSKGGEYPTFRSFAPF